MEASYDNVESEEFGLVNTNVETVHIFDNTQEINKLNYKQGMQFFPIITYLFKFI